MATLGIELSDVGVNAVLIKEDGSSRTLALGNEADSLPACAYARAGELWFGAEAQEMNFVYPGRTCSKFIDEFT